MYILHSVPDSASTIVQMVLEELGLPHESRPIDREAGELDSPAYRAMNPLGLFPALQTPDGPMFETAAILLYLSDKHGGSEGQVLAPAPGSPDRAAFLKWYFFTSFNIHPTVLQLFYPERTAGPHNTAEVVAHAKARLTDLLQILDGVAATRPAFLSDTQPTIFGYYIAVLMRWMAADFPSRNYPALHRVLAYLETRPATQACAAAEGLGPHPFTQI